MTDANLVLGRLLPNFFPKIFGPKENEPLDEKATRAAFKALTNEVRKYNNVQIPGIFLPIVSSSLYMYSCIFTLC